MKKQTAISLIVISAFSVAAQAAPRDLVNGKEKYEETCIACHGENGKPTIPGLPDFTSRTGPLKKGNSALVKSVMEGVDRPGADMAMPPLGGNPDLTEDDVRDILSYIRKTFKGK
ncbi:MULTISPECIES: c-type cytochrome [Kordiimonas]|jgi:cytochrome c5|uniref:c-type cytochrome n=1 Tax=Kordiimonas TaxID=288021 RepID=UPI00257E7A64|nr:cytochrome c [Kordiimonas sp. UBA4487]